MPTGRSSRIIRGCLAGALCLASLATSVESAVAEAVPAVAQTDIVGPAGSMDFGPRVFVLSNGNYVVTDPRWSNGTDSDVGAIYLYDGQTNALISTLTGSRADDFAGQGIIEVGDSNVLIGSPNWDGLLGDGARGAVTWMSGTTGLNGTIAESNSLHGTQPGDFVGTVITPLASGHGVVASAGWSLGTTPEVGAVTVVSGNAPIVGPVTTSNSLHGTREDDSVGVYGVRAGNGSEFFVNSHRWDLDDTIEDVGAVTPMDATSPLTGPVTTSNSLHGSTADDVIGDLQSGFTGSINNSIVLPNGQYVVRSPKWDNGLIVDAGAVTLLDGDAVTGPITTSNSLHGSSASDRVGFDDGALLSSGDVVVQSSLWNDGRGAVTHMVAGLGVTGPVTALNSLVGGQAGDRVGSVVRTLTNGNYVVVSSGWRNGSVNSAGAVTWVSGSAGLVGLVTTSNSLHGANSSDRVGSTVVALENGNYAVRSEQVDGGPPASGGVLIGDGTSGTSGVMGVSNSLYGDTGDRIGGRLTPLSNGHVLVGSWVWDLGAVENVGAATLVDGVTGLVGPVTTSNSLHGSQQDDRVGEGGTAIVGGDYLVLSRSWANGLVGEAGAITRGDSDVGITGPVTTSNSFHGTIETERVGYRNADQVDANYVVVRSPRWNRGPAGTPGAVTPIGPDTETSGPLNSNNSGIGTPPGSMDLDPLFTPSYTEPGNNLGVTTAGAIPIVTGQNRVLLLSIDGVEPPAPTGPDIVSVDPARLLDTRANGETVDDRFEKIGKVDAGEFVELDVLGRGGVPASGVGSVVLNVTMIRPDGNGFVTIYPCGDRPDASSMNAPNGKGVVANEVIAKVSSTGTLCLYSSVGTNIAADVTGYVPSSSGVVPLTPARLLDTRANGETVDDRFEKLGKVDAGEFVELDVLGRGGVPASGVGSVVLNVTMIRPDGNGFVTIYPCGDRPDASSMNAPNGGGVVANEVIAKASSIGTLCLYTSVGTNLAADVTGYVSSSSGAVSVDPARLLDTRANGETVDDRFEKLGKVDAGEFVELDVLGRGGVPASGVGSVVLNVTMIRPDGNGFVTIYSCGDRPDASSMNAPNSGGVVANEVIAKVSSTGTLCLYTSVGTNIAADVTGYIAS